MDARKIQFLIGMQREIDKLEAKEGNTPKIEKVKSRFYDVVEVDEVASAGRQITQDADKEPPVLMPKANEVTLETKLQRRKYTPEEVEENQARLAQLKNERGLLKLDEVSTDTMKTDTFISPSGTTQGEVVRPAIRKRPVGFKNNLMNVKKEKEAEPEKTFPHKPKDVADFMKLFDSANDLKYLTHDFDEADKIFDIYTFLKQSKITFDLYTNKYTIPISLWGIINQFAFDKNPKWSAIGKSVIEGWSSPTWIDWSKSQGHPSKNRDFDNVIQLFKELTRVKSLQKIVESAIDKKFEDKKRLFNFTFVELDKADFYTHVGRLTLALSHLFDEICGRVDRPDVTIQYERQTVGDYRHRIIHIHHHESYPLNKSMDEVFEKYRQHGGHLWEVREKLFGYCDWHIETVWDEQPVRIHLLREGMKANEVDVEVETLNSIPLRGFTHTLTFYFR